MFFFSRNLSHYVVRIFHIILEKLEGQFFFILKNKCEEFQIKRDFTVQLDSVVTLHYATRPWRSAFLTRPETTT